MTPAFSILLISWLTGFNSPVQSSLPTDEKYFMKIAQGGIQYEINPGENKITLKKSGFDILFILNQFSTKQNHFLQFAADTSDVIFKKVKKGVSTEKLSNFAGASGMAGYRNDPYHEMVLCDYG